MIIYFKQSKSTCFLCFLFQTNDSSVIQNTGLPRRKHDILILTIGGLYALSTLFSHCFWDRLFADQI